MQKHLTLFFSALFMLIACNSGNKPNDLIEKDKMIRLMTDIHLIDGSLANQTAPDSLYRYGTGRYNVLFKQYGVDSGTFKRSLRYYAAKPEELLAMYDALGKALTAKSDSLTKIQRKIDEGNIKKIKANAKLMEKKYASIKQRAIDSLKRDSVTRQSLIKARLLNRRRPGQIK